MKKIYPLGNSPVLKNCIILMVFISGIIYSCKKDDRTGQQTPDNAAIAAAKTWYQNAYPSGSNSTSTIRTNSLDTAADLSQIIIPDWQHAATYIQQNKQVIEIPLDPSARHGFALENKQSGKLANSKENSKASFILLKEGNSYQAYLMIIMADSAYIKNAPGKLAGNTYQKIDTAFTGHVLYLTPKGKYVKDSVYLTKQAIKARTAAIIGCTLAQNAIHIKKTNSTGPKTQAVTTGCVDWYLDTYVNGVLVDMQYEYTSCPLSCDQGGGGGVGGTTASTPDTNYDEAALQQIALEVARHPNFLLDCDSLQLLQIAAYNNYGNMYQNVAGFHPDQTVMDRINTLQSNSSVFQTIDNFDLQNLDGAFGSIVNSDFFPVRITALPPGMDMASITEYFRLHMTNFTSGQATFDPYNFLGTNDTQLFNQSGSLSKGALVHIGMFNDGTVIESDYQSNTNGTYFKFSTMTSPLDFNHPVSGNREFGIYPDLKNPGSYTFYTMGVDRLSDWKFALGGEFVDAFGAGDQLWSAMQINMINYINAHGGNAEFYNKKSYTARPDYDIVKDYLKGQITLEELKQKIGC